MHCLCLFILYFFWVEWDSKQFNWKYRTISQWILSFLKRNLRKNTIFLAIHSYKDHVSWSRRISFFFILSTEITYTLNAMNFQKCIICIYIIRYKHIARLISIALSSGTNSVLIFFFHYIVLLMSNVIQNRFFTEKFLC